MKEQVTFGNEPHPANSWGRYVKEPKVQKPHRTWKESFQVLLDKLKILDVPDLVVPVVLSPSKNVTMPGLSFEKHRFLPFSTSSMQSFE